MTDTTTPKEPRDPRVRLAADTPIPELLRAAPAARAVLDRYGLQGCGGALGPDETLGFFARAHGVPLDRLVQEIRTTLARPSTLSPLGGGSPPSPSPADTIYRPFFRAGIAVTLTLGASWGAFLLLKIGFTGAGFGAVRLHEVNAHGHAQIFGWVTLFIMGFAYQAFPRFKHTRLSHPHLALWSLPLLLTGILLRGLLEPFFGESTWVRWPLALGSAAELAGVAIFLYVLRATFRTARTPPEPYDGYVRAALFWFALQALLSAVYTQATLGPVPYEELLRRIAAYQASLRELQVHGFILLMILGVSQRFFHHFYGFPPPNPRRSARALPLLNLAVAAEAAGILLMREVHHVFAALWYGGVLLLAGTVLWLVLPWRIFQPTAEGDRSLKFLRAGYVWLGVSLGLLVLLPAYQFGLLAHFAPASHAARIGFSHAYYGALRHAITVGFISLMILGVAAKVVPTLMGVSLRGLRPLWLPFLLVNAGCALRVAGQILTDFTLAAYPAAGVSGLLEVTGIALWGVHLWRIMAGRFPPGPVPAPAGLRPGEPIQPHHRVGEILAAYPHLLEVFLAKGFRPLANPVLRRTIAGQVTLIQAARHHGLDVEELLGELNARAEERAAPPRTP